MSDTDNNSNEGQIDSTISITKAADESDITQYVLYWGSDATTKYTSTPIAVIEKTGSDLTYNIPASPITQIPGFGSGNAASHFLVFTTCGAGESNKCISTLIDDLSL